MAMTDLYKKNDISSRDYRVYIRDVTDSSDAELDAIISAFLAIDSVSDIDNFISTIPGSFNEVGKLDRALTFGTEVGETIMDNTGVENVINMNGNMSMEHIAVNNATKKTFRELDGKDIAVFYVANKGKDYTLFLLPTVRYDYEQSSTSGNIVRLPISATKEINSTSEFRKINQFTEA
jgi:hypothetical protein